MLLFNMIYNKLLKEFIKVKSVTIHPHLKGKFNKVLQFTHHLRGIL